MIQIPVKSTPFDVAVALANVDTSQLANSGVTLQCYPSGNPMTLLLPLSTFNGNLQNVKLLIAAVDGAGGAISVQPSGGEKLNGYTTVTTMTNSKGYSSATATIAGTGLWVIQTNDIK
jgi:hypothetical protein